MKSYITNYVSIVLSIFLLAQCRDTSENTSRIDEDINGSEVCQQIEDASSLHIIPKPKQVEVGNQCFVLSGNDFIVVEDESLLPLGDYLAEQVKELTHIELESGNKLASFGKIILVEVDQNISDNEEAYELKITRNRISIKGSSKKGVLYGMQTFLQIVFQCTIGNGSTSVIPSLRIVDEPYFKWRGMHLDVSRHFFSVDFVKKMLDMLALHKMNQFHWHLTDDQGWRIEIKKYPLLATKSSVRKETVIGCNTGQFDGVPYGGYYTQEEIVDVVHYAAKLGIEVVPEIELPGHAVAVLASYPQYSCTGGPFEVYKQWGVSKDVFCAGKDETFVFLQDILDEVVNLFPGRYIHIGGDECPKDRWKVCSDCQKRMKDNNLNNEMELQSYFIKRIENYIASKGKKLIGWDEILEGGLPERATVMSWRGMSGGIEAAKAGHDVIMSPVGYCYFDYYQGPKENEPLAFNATLTMDKVYDFELIPDELSSSEAKRILGGQANIWTEYITTDKHAEYMIFPRLCAMSEVLWGNESQRDYDEFLKRLSTHLQMLNHKNINYRNLDK